MKTIDLKLFELGDFILAIRVYNYTTRVSFFICEANKTISPFVKKEHSHVECHNSTHFILKEYGLCRSLLLILYLAIFKKAVRINQFHLRLAQGASVNYDVTIVNKPFKNPFKWLYQSYQNRAYHDKLKSEMLCDILKPDNCNKVKIPFYKSLLKVFSFKRDLKFTDKQDDLKTWNYNRINNWLRS